MGRDELFMGLRFGVHLPGRLRAGSYRGAGGWSFWDVADPGKAVTIHLRDNRYRKLVVEVEDPADVVTSIRAAVRRGTRQEPCPACPGSCCPGVEERAA